MRTGDDPQTLARRFAAARNSAADEAIPLADVFGDDLGAVCVIDNFFLESAVLANSNARIDVRQIISQIRNHYFDSDTKVIYLISANGEVVSRFEVADLHPVFRIDRTAQAMACLDPQSVVYIHEGAGGGVFVRFTDEVRGEAR